MKISQDLKKHTTFGVQAMANSLKEFHSLDELKHLVKISKNQAFMVLGGGSNVLFTQNFKGVILKNGMKGIMVIKKTEDHVFVEVEAGENWHEFVLHAIEQGWAGIENLSLIPGTVGAAPMQNIGAYGVELEQVFEHLHALHIETGEMRRFSHAECNFGYRNSFFKQGGKGKYIITSVVFRLNLKPSFNTSYGAIESTLKTWGVKELSLKAISDAVIHIRRSKLPDPAKLGNAGSFFKNPIIAQSKYQDLKERYPEMPAYELPNDEVKVPAAWLIEQAGWKGHRRGPIGVHSKQPLVLVNYGGGEGRKIKKLAEDIRLDIMLKFGIDLEPEVNMI